MTLDPPLLLLPVQYGSAKDPVNMAGMVAANVVRGDMPVAQWDDLKAIRAEPNSMLLDVREVGGGWRGRGGRKGVYSAGYARGRWGVEGVRREEREERCLFCWMWERWV